MTIFWSKFRMKTCDINLNSAQNIDCGNTLLDRNCLIEYHGPTIYVLNRNIKNNVYPVNPSILYESGVGGVLNNMGCWHDVLRTFKVHIL